MTTTCGPLSTGFVCPLRRTCLSAGTAEFASFEACNLAVGRIRRLGSGDERDRAIDEIFQRLLPLIRKTLRRFCHPMYQGSRCEAGACYPEELVGETFLVLWEATNTFDPSRQVDFIGYFGQHLFWRLEHKARQLRRAQREIELSPDGDDWAAGESEEDALLVRATADELLARLDPDDAALLASAAGGYSTRYLAERAGVTEAALRKRLQRLRERLKPVEEKT